jgi:hypothetical protein
MEAFDGRIQAHGFVETQIRGLSEGYGLDDEELDLAQWYNILNIELEFDILPDGWGPIDLMSAYVRVEGRYDCIYTHGCGMFPSVNTYGNDVDRLPKRLRDARDPDYTGVINMGDSKSRIQNQTAARLGGLREPVPFGGLTATDPPKPKLWREVWNYPGLDQDFSFYGADGLPVNPLDPSEAPTYRYSDPVYPSSEEPRWNPGRDGDVGTVDDFGPDLEHGTADDPRIQKIPGLQAVFGQWLWKCDPDLGCPGSPGRPVSAEFNPRVVDEIVKRDQRLRRRHGDHPDHRPLATQGHHPPAGVAVRQGQPLPRPPYPGDLQQSFACRKSPDFPVQ